MPLVSKKQVNREMRTTWFRQFVQLPEMTAQTIHLKQIILISSMRIQCKCKFFIACKSIHELNMTINFGFNTFKVQFRTLIKK